MKVFVITTHCEYEGNCPETYVEGVTESREKAETIRKEAFEQQRKLNWVNIDKENIEEEHYNNYSTLYDTCNSNYLRVEIWERDVE